MSVLGQQLVDVQGRHPKALLEQTTDGQSLLVVPDVQTGAGWNLQFVTVRVLVPVGFPHVKLDCFYTDAELRLSTGTDPEASNVQNVFGGLHRWFSWHLLSWDPTNASLDQYVNFCRWRLQEAR